MFEPILIQFLGFLIGAVFKSTYDFLWKLLQTPDTSWNHKYTMSLLISVILSMMTATVKLSTIQPPVENGVTWIFLSSLTEGFLVNHIVNKPISYLSKSGNKEVK